MNIIFDNKNIEIIDTVGAFEIIIPFSLDFITKKNVVINNLKTENKGKVSLLKSKNLSELPIVINSSRNDVFAVKIIITNNEKQVITFQLIFYLEDRIELCYNVHFNVETKETEIFKNKSRRIRRIISFSLTFLIIFGLFIFNFTNENVYRSIYVLSPSIFGFFATFLLTFLGINLIGLKKIFKKLRSAQNLFKNPEVYFNADIFKFFSHSFVPIVLSLLFSGQLYFYYIFASYKLPEKGKYSFFIDDKLITEEKVYYNDINKISVYLKEVEYIKPEKRIPVGKLKFLGYPYLGELIIDYTEYNYCENCYLPVKTKISAHEIINNSNNERNKILLEKLKGNDVDISYENSDSTFCYSNIKILNAGFAENFDSLLSFTLKIYSDSINNYFESLSKGINQDKDKLKYFSLYDTLKLKVIDHFNKNYSIFIKQYKKFPSNDDIADVYDNIVNFQNKFDKQKPFYTGGGLITFTKLIELLILFESTKDQINKNAFNYYYFGKLTTGR
jgi:hypothetical protein